MLTLLGILIFSAAVLADTITITFKDGSVQSFTLNRPSSLIDSIRFASGAGGETGAAAPSNINLARGKKATQSSTGYGGNPKRAVDGNANGNWNNQSVTHTAKETGAWWQVDLGASHRIKIVRLWNRTDCCADRLSNFYVLVSNTPFTNNLSSSVGQSGVWHYHYRGKAGVQTDIPVSQAGRYVRIQLASSNYLSLAEVQVISQ